MRAPILIISAIFATSTLTHAHADDFDVCVKLANSGLIDSRDTSIAKEQASRDFNFVCSQTQDRVTRAQGLSSGSNIGLGDFSVGLSNSKSQSEASEYINKVCSEGEKKYTENFHFNENVRTGQYVVQLVNSCISILATRYATETIFGYVEPSITSDELFGVRFEYKVGTESRHKWTLTAIQANYRQRSTAHSGRTALRRLHLIRGLAILRRTQSNALSRMESPSLVTSYFSQTGAK